MYLPNYIIDIIMDYKREIEEYEYFQIFSTTIQYTNICDCIACRYLY